MEVLDGSATQAAIGTILAQAKWARIAVAYWGREAISHLALEKLRLRDIEIVCDVVSGSCNIDEVKALRNLLGSDHVKTHDRLHAKMWLTDKAAIVGSSNASANGLGFEGSEARSLTELNLLVRRTVQEVRMSGYHFGLQRRSWFGIKASLPRFCLKRSTNDRAAALCPVCLVSYRRIFRKSRRAEDG